MCGRFGSILGSTQSTEGELADIASLIGDNCMSHGEPLPPTPDSVQPFVAIGHQEHSGGDDRVKSCNTCTNCIPGTDVYPALRVDVAGLRSQGVVDPEGGCGGKGLHVRCAGSFGTLGSRPGSR